MRTLVLAACALLLVGCGQRAVDSGSTLPGTVAGGTTAPSTSTSTAPSTSSEAAVTPELSPHGKDVLARARSAGATTVVLTVSTERDATDRAAEALRRLGATVEATDATIGYLRVSVPVDLAERVPSVEGVHRVDVDEPLANADPTP